MSKDISSFWLGSELNEFLTLVSEKTGKSKSQIIREAFRLWIEHQLKQWEGQKQ